MVRSVLFFPVAHPWRQSGWRQVGGVAWIVGELLRRRTLRGVRGASGWFAPIYPERTL